MAESRNFSESKEDKAEAKKESARLTCSAESLFTDEEGRALQHPLMDFFDNVPFIVSERPLESDWATIASLLKDSRKLKISYPFCEEKISVTIQTYYKMLSIGLFKKERFPIKSPKRNEDIEKEEEEEELARKKEIEGYCIQSLKKALSHLVQHDSQVTSPDTKVDQEAVQKSVEKSHNVFILRTNNFIGRKELPEDVRKDFIRLQVKDDPREREEVVLSCTEGSIMRYLYLYAISRKNEELSDIEKIYLYLLLLDPQMKDMPISVQYHETLLVMRIRALLHEAVNYALAMTLNGPGDPDDREWRETCRDLTKSVSAKVFDVLVGDSFVPSEEKKKRKKHPKSLSDCERNFELLKRDKTMELEDLEPLGRLPANAKKWKFPNEALRMLAKKLKNASVSSDSVFIGLLNLLRKRQKDTRSDSEK